MSIKIRRLFWALSFLLIATEIMTSTSEAEEFASGIPITRESKDQIIILGYATDPTGDIAWSAGHVGVADMAMSG